MFTGIIETIGKVVKYDGNRLGIRAPFRRVRLGESVCVDGVCLTVARKAGLTLFFDVGPETRRVTALGALRPGSRVNLERALRLGDRVGGHWVAGHVESTGTVQETARTGRSRWMEIALPQVVARYVAPKGSLAVDGVSLTVVSLKKNSVKIMLVPHTLSHTTLGAKKPGDAVNLEADVLSRYAFRQR